MNQTISISKSAKLLFPVHTSTSHWVWNDGMVFLSLQFSAFFSRSSFFLFSFSDLFSLPVFLFFIFVTLHNGRRQVVATFVRKETDSIFNFFKRFF